MKIHIPFFLFLSLIFLIYSNTFDSSWQLDDYHNILNNPEIQIDHLDLQSLIQPILASLKDGNVNRPFAFLTFAVNWYFGGNDPFGYHVFNLTVHLLTTFFLFLTFFNLYCTPNLREHHNSNYAYVVSLLAAVLWAVNPIQTQAVTYVVQRMASMAALFYILSLYLYLKARLSEINLKRILLFAGCGISFFFGLASKENTITLPAAILLVEWIFFADLRHRRTWIILGGITLGCLFLIVGFGSLLFLNGNLLGIFNYGTRYFSLIERILTEPRIILFYVTQIFYPAPTRLSIEHDVILSTSMFHPWNTLPSIFIIIALVSFAFLRLRKWPILCFAILFFFLNHAIESSVIGLELIFEHRNYLPSMFLFLPVVVGIHWLMEYYRARSPWMRAVLLSFISLIIVGYGFSTYVRNITWGSAKMLWEDAMTKAPNASRPLNNLALTHYQRIGDHKMALKLYYRALNHNKHNKSHDSILFNNIAGIYYKRGDYKKAEEFWEKTIKSNPAYTHARYYLALTQTKLGKYESASQLLAEIIRKHPKHFNAINLKGIIAFTQNEIAQSLAYFQKGLKLAPFKKESLINIGSAHAMLNHYERAEFYFKQVLYKYPNEPIALLWLIKIYLAIGDKIAADFYVDKLYDFVGIKNIVYTLKLFSKNTFYADSIVTPFIEDKMTRQMRRHLTQASNDIDRQLASF